MNAGILDAFGNPPGLPKSALPIVGSTTPRNGAARVDFLNIFGAEYDDYIVYFNGVLPNSTDSLVVQLAIGGILTTFPNYSGAVGSSITSSSGNGANITINTVLATGKGCSGKLEMYNANDAVNDKQIFSLVGFHQDATPRYTSALQFTQCVTNSTASGFTLYWSGGATFQGVGSVRVYGVSKQ